MRYRLRWYGTLLTALFGVIGCGPATFVVGVAPGGQRLQATVVEDDGRPFSPRVAMIDVTGLIANADQSGLLSAGYNPVATLTEALDAAAADPKVKAVLLRINSPGGTVTASDIMYREVKRFRQRSGKPVVVLMMDVAASGGFYLACAGDHVVAYPTTITGSVGVVLQTLSVKPALERIGVRAEALVSGPNKAAGSPLETLDDGQRAVLQGLVDAFYADFVAVVRENRTEVSPESWSTVTDGRVFTGERAHELGLVDQVGDLRDAFAAAKEKAGLSSADLVLYHRPLEYVASPYSHAPLRTDPAGVGVGTQINLLQVNLDRALPGADAGAYYLWRPELP
ncbi:MAG: signal peptide peptidase SppA [Planctomycetota bacterium]